MSTRCNVHFTHRGSLEANVYKHWDGYPESDGGVLAFIDRFFRAVLEESPSDTRFDDPSYLAARFIVFAAREMRPGLGFTGLGVMREDAGDAAYIYEIECGGPLGERPAVRFKKHGTDKWLTSVEEVEEVES